MTNTSQKEKIAARLKNGLSITPLEALSLYGCFRLASRISELKKEGLDIVCNIVERVNEDGERKQFAEYHLRRGI
jgi:hypothetical protein